MLTETMYQCPKGSSIVPSICRTRKESYKKQTIERVIEKDLETVTYP
jgi:hypothetical protein